MFEKAEATLEVDHGPTSPDSASVDMEDKAVMAQMGIKQQLQRRFNFISILALSMTLLSSWEAVAGAWGVGLYAGGPVALIWGWFLTFSGTLALAASIAEMASMCPISGAQYHWTYMFAPPKWRVPITFMQGWVTVFAWQATITSLTYIIATQWQAIVVLNWPNYVFERWHSVLMIWGFVAVSYAINVWFIRILPATELFSGICHILFFFALAIVMLAIGRNADAEFVFTTYVNETGWTNDGVAWFIGLLPNIWCIIGFDGAIHLSEETTRSATTIPKIIIATVMVNGMLAWLFLLLTLFSISSLDDVLGDTTGYPIIQVFYQVTGTHTGASLMEAAVATIGVAAVFGTLASVSRLTWAFARDNGLPFSNFFKHVNGRYQVPIRAISLVSTVICLLSLIDIGSSVALNAILSLSTISLYVSYIIPISCLLHKRWRSTTTRPGVAGAARVTEDQIAFGPFSLGRFGPIINIYAVCYATMLIPFMALPTSLPLTAETMNYAGPIFLFVLIFAACDYAIRGRHKFRGPAGRLIERDD